MLVGLGVTLAALAVRLEFEWLPRGSEFVTFFPALAVVACLCGWPVALGSIVLAALASWWLFLGGAIGETANAGAEVALFIAGSVAVVAVVEALTRAALGGADPARAGSGASGRSDRVVAAYLAAVASFDEAADEPASCGNGAPMQSRLDMLNAIAEALHEVAQPSTASLQRACDTTLKGRRMVPARVGGVVPPIPAERLAAIAIVIGEVRLALGARGSAAPGATLGVMVMAGPESVDVELRAIEPDGTATSALLVDCPPMRGVEQLARRLGATLVAVETPPMLRVSLTT